MSSVFKEFYSDPYMQLRSTAITTAVCLLFCIPLYFFHSAGFYQFHFSWVDLALIPLGMYAGGISVIWIHNATHNSFSWRWLNEACGHIAGVHQLWGFKGWKFIHLVHHQYADVDGMDPHNHNDVTFWQFARVMTFRSIAKIQQRYREHWGESQGNWLFRSRLFFLLLAATLVIASLLVWYMLLGPAGFLFIYIPSYITHYLLVTNVNYSAHPKDPATGEHKPANLDETLHHKIVNFFLFGVYYHANHHRKPFLFNPKKMPVRKSKPMMPELAAAQDIPA